MDFISRFLPRFSDFFTSEKYGYFAIFSIAANTMEKRGKTAFHPLGRRPGNTTNLYMEETK